MGSSLSPHLHKDSNCVVLALGAQSPTPAPGRCLLVSPCTLLRGLPMTQHQAEGGVYPCSSQQSGAGTPTAGRHVGSQHQRLGEAVAEFRLHEKWAVASATEHQRPERDVGKSPRRESACSWVQRTAVGGASVSQPRQGWLWNGRIAPLVPVCP